MIEKKPTIYDLADSLNISVGTVYRALHNTGRISAATKERVLAKAAEMNFKLNPTAQALSRTPVTIGVILCCPVVPFLDEIHAGVEYEFETLSQHNIFSDIRVLPHMNADECPEQICQYLQEFVERNYAGVILFLSGSHHKCTDALLMVEKAQIPMVCLINDIPMKNRKAYITADGYCAGRIAAELLSISCANQRIAILTGDSSFYMHKLNLAGFMDEAGKDLFAVANVYEHQDRAERVEQQLIEIFRHEPAYQGLYITSASSTIACPLLMEINKDKRVKVIATDLFPQIKAPLEEGVITATIFQNPFLQGRKAVASIYHHLRNEPRGETIMIAPQIVMRSNIGLYHINEQSKTEN